MLYLLLLCEFGGENGTNSIHSSHSRNIKLSDSLNDTSVSIDSIFTNLSFRTLKMKNPPLRIMKSLSSFIAFFI